MIEIADPFAIMRKHMEPSDAEKRLTALESTVESLYQALWALMNGSESSAKRHIREAGKAMTE